jgi:hypothetical protein
VEGKLRLELQYTFSIPVAGVLVACTSSVVVSAADVAHYDMDFSKRKWWAHREFGQVLYVGHFTVFECSIEFPLVSHDSCLAWCLVGRVLVYKDIAGKRNIYMWDHNSSRAACPHDVPS